MATTLSQLQTALDTLSQDILGTLQPGANVSGPVMAALLTRQTALVKDLSTLQAAGASVLRFGSGAPSNSLGANGDLYRNTQNGDEYQKVAGAYVLRQNLKGKDGYTPQKGKDYVDGKDGLDGNEIVDKSYAPTTADNAGYKEGDQWFYTKSVTEYERYAYQNGAWRLVFQKAEGSTGTPSAYTSDPQSYTTSSTDYSAKCGTGTSGSSVTKSGYTASSTVSKADANAIALANAKADALAAIVCPVTQPPATTYTATQQQYSTTPQDYFNACGKAYEGTYVPIVRTNSTETSAVSQADANAKALAAATQAARNAITCQVSPVVYDNTVTAGQTLKGVTLGAAAGDTLEFNNATGADNSPAVMELWLGGEQVAQVPYENYYMGKPFRYSHNGQKYTKNFAGGRIDL